MNLGGFVLPAAVVGLGALLIRPQRGFYNLENSDGDGLAPIVAQAVLEEDCDDDLVITDHPVEQGAVVTDHAYKLPATVTIRMVWSDSPSTPGGLVGAAIGAASAIGGPRLGTAIGIAASLPSTIRAAQSILTGYSQNQTKEMYQRLLQLQESRVPFDVYTGKRQFRSMLFKSLRMRTDNTSENILPITAVCRQVIVVNTQVVVVAAAQQSTPETTGATILRGAQNLVPAPQFTPPDWLGAP